MDDMQRQHLITRKDLTNLQKKLGLREFEKSSNDMDSVGVWIEEHASIEHESRRDENGSITPSPFFAFNPLTAENKVFTLGKKLELIS